MSFLDDQLTLLGIANDASEHMQGEHSFSLRWDHNRDKPEIEGYLDADWWPEDSETFRAVVGRCLDPQLDEQIHLYDGVIKAEFTAGTITLRRRNSGMRQSWEPVVVGGQERAA